MSEKGLTEVLAKFESERVLQMSDSVVVFNVVERVAERKFVKILASQ